MYDIIRHIVYEGKNDDEEEVEEIILSSYFFCTATEFINNVSCYIKLEY
jgi:hypothetical protein